MAKILWHFEKKEVEFVCSKPLQIFEIQNFLQSFQSFEIKIFLQPWWRYFDTSKIEVEFVRSKPLQIFEIQNFLQPWRRYFVTSRKKKLNLFVLSRCKSLKFKIFFKAFKALKLRFFFNHGEDTLTLRENRSWICSF